MQPGNINRILIIRLSSLGDVLLTTPVIRALKKQFPGAVIDFLVKEEYSNAVKFNPNINVVYALSRSEKIKFLLKILKRNNYNFVVDLQNNIRSRIIAGYLNIITYSFKKPTWNKYLLVKFKINRYKEIKSITQMYCESVPGLKLDKLGLELYTPQITDSALLHDKNYIGFCPGSKHFTKRWPAEYFIELGENLINNGYKLVLFGGAEDKQVCDFISCRVKGSINLCSSNDIFKTAADIKRCKVVVCNDSGLMHVAASAGVPVVALFGSSVKEFGFSPYGIPNIILENKSLSCRPCSHIGMDNCAKKHFKCMKEITPQIVYNNLTQFLSKL
ncbi:MAG: lipopolysaccharide heptosyltransferase II [Bacteroidota bacterium]